MAEKPSITGFLKNILGLQRPKAKAPTDTPAVATPSPVTEQTTPPVPVKTRTPTQSDAYKTRKKGRKLHKDSWEDMERIVNCLQTLGEATPGQLASQLGVARSSLAYNLNRLLARKRIERLGAGPRIRYRTLQNPKRG